MVNFPVASYISRLFSKMDGSRKLVSGFPLVDFVKGLDRGKMVLFVACVSYPMACSAIVGFHIRENIRKWYKKLKKPWFAPADYLFKPVWISLYFCMGCSSYFILSSPESMAHPLNSLGLGVFLAQFMVNIFWCPTFFIEHRIYISALISNLLQFLVGMNICIFYQIRPLASYFLIPYYLWVCLASALTTELALLNDDHDDARRSK